MGKRSLPTTQTPQCSTETIDVVSLDSELARKRVRHLPPKSAESPLPLDSNLKWLQQATNSFVDNIPPLTWTGGYYSWGAWLDQLRQPHLWTSIKDSTTQNDSKSVSKRPWRVLIDICRRSKAIQSPGAIHHIKTKLVTSIINLVYRRAEQQRISHQGQTQATEQDILRRVRAVVNRQRRHDDICITFIRLLDLAFVLSAYKGCRLVMASKQTELSAEVVEDQVESELQFLATKPTPSEIRNNITRMEQYMWQQQHLPWYERVPNVRTEMLLRTQREALAFCDKLPFPNFKSRATGRSLQRDTLTSVAAMDEWLVSLLDKRWIDRWSLLAGIYETATSDQYDEEEALLEEISRRVVEKILEPLTEVNDPEDPLSSKLIDTRPEIVATQSSKIPGRLTFRQLLELYIHLTLFRSYLLLIHQTANLPRIEDIHSGTSIFEEIKTQVMDVRTVISADKADTLVDWCLAPCSSYLPEFQEQNGMPADRAYQVEAIRAALGPAVLYLPETSKIPRDNLVLGQSDPLMYAVATAEWDPPLALKIIDASFRLGWKAKMDFERGNGTGLDLYAHRRVTVCDAAIVRCGGDRKAAARIVNKLYPVWGETECDKGVGRFTPNGIMLLRIAAEKGNFEAASMLGVLLSAEPWEERRIQCGIPRDVDNGLKYVCQSLSFGDTSAAMDLIYLLQAGSIPRPPHVPYFTSEHVNHAMKCFRSAASEEASLGVFLGYLLSTGAPGVGIDYKGAFAAFEKTLISPNASTKLRVLAANNLGALTDIMLSSGKHKTRADKLQSKDYFTLAARTGDAKAVAALVSWKGSPAVSPVTIQERFCSNILT